MPIKLFDMSKPSRTTLLVTAISFIIAVALTVALWDITYWPTDAEDYYLTAAQKIAHSRFISDIHKSIDAEKVRWAHGKEIFFLFISFAQRLLNDSTSLRPVILVCVLSVFLSSVLIYFIAARYWGEKIALICWSLFATSAWPYMYILMAKHQPAGLLFFLAAVFLLFFAGRTPRKRFFFFGSGISLGLALFSSTVSGLYFPYYIAAFLHGFAPALDKNKNFLKVFLKNNLAPLGLILLGLLAPFLYINLPDVFHNINSYREYVQISGKYNHFFYNQPFLQQWFPFMPVADIRGGWLWIFRYFMTIMPVLFPVYLLGLIYLVKQSLARKKLSFSLSAGGVMALSLAPLLMAEAIKVAQYGANYFPELIGIIVLVGFCLRDMENTGLISLQNTANKKPWLNFALAVILLAHLGVNAAMFGLDIYPCRMDKTFLSRKIEELKIYRLSTYINSLHRNAFITCLSPRVLQDLTFNPIRSLIEAKEGYILVPPITGDSIYIAATSPYIHFDKDLFLNTLIEKGNLGKYAVASFRTLANSRFWLHEEEILSYRNLMLGHKFEDNDVLGRVWLLDAAKLQKDLRQNMPMRDDLDLMQNDIRRIGALRKFLIYKGIMTRQDKDMQLRQITAEINKVGAPEDSLIAYVYKVDAKQFLWVPAGEKFYSGLVPAPAIASERAVFRFDPPLYIKKGPHYIVIYRTGKPSDKDFYEINVKDISLQ